MRYHESDRGKRASELWKDACCLHHLLQINLERYPKGTVIRKHSVQKRVLRDGKEKTYSYYYENVDVWGEGQYHLPVKRKWRPKERLWDLRCKVLYRKEVEERIESLRKRLANGIRAMNVYRGSKETSGTVEEVLRLAGEAMGRRARYQESRRRARGKIQGVELVTDLGERVRSKNECLFAGKLREMGIPYLYEMAVGEQRPDFTIFIGEEMYFVELLGMMDRGDYREDLEERLERYKSMKIYPGERLVLIDMTEGVDMRHVEEVLRGLCIGKAPPGIEAAYGKKAVKG